MNDNKNNCGIETIDIKFNNLTDDILVKDGKTAVLTSSKQWDINSIDAFRFNPKIIGLILEKKKFMGNLRNNENLKIKKYNDDANIFNEIINKQIMEYCKTKYNYNSHGIHSWPKYLKVNWLQKNTFFVVTYDRVYGESILTIQDSHWTKT